MQSPVKTAFKYAGSPQSCYGQNAKLTNLRMKGYISCGSVKRVPMKDHTVLQARSGEIYSKQRPKAAYRWIGYLELGKVSDRIGSDEEDKLIYRC